ncbi:hypothetical protein ACV1CY_21215 [Aeromonas caviae]
MLLSDRHAWEYADLTLRDDSTLAQSVQAARQEAERQQEAGVDTEALEAMARALLGNGQFEETEEDIPQMLEEFYPEAETENTPAQTGDMASPATAAVKPKATTPIRQSRLTSKLGSASPTSNQPPSTATAASHG